MRINISCHIFNIIVIIIISCMQTLLWHMSDPSPSISSDRHCTLFYTKSVNNLNLFSESNKKIYSDEIVILRDDPSNQGADESTLKIEVKKDCVLCCIRCNV
jgi:hypothetical protein